MNDLLYILSNLIIANFLTFSFISNFKLIFIVNDYEIYNLNFNVFNFLCMVMCVHMQVYVYVFMLVFVIIEKITKYLFSNLT